MKKCLSYCFAILVFIACQNDNLESYYIRLEKTNISVEAVGILMNINVQANCDWGISETPNWCIVQKTVSDGKECLKIEIGNDAKSGWCRIGSNDQNCTILVICVS
ncbi:BACON domain-containing protein [Alistipes onderdonkii]|nr:BACON domain-containing protein [Alistipes onderdonkii]KAA2751574.1 BACON domain-containing protein [Alistipes onderdonkii]